MSFVTRFAPSPSGGLHLGHAFSAWTAWSAAQEAGGEFILRIEDIDTTRCKPEFEPDIFDDLHWLGLEWKKPVRRQSEHFADYANMLEKLKTLGLVYRCFKTRTEILDEIARAPHTPTNSHSTPYKGPLNTLSMDEESTLLDAGKPYAWRLSLAKCRDHLGSRFEQMFFIEKEKGAVKSDPSSLGDVVLARKDVGTSYHMAVVHDDALQGISHVIRGVDLFEQTPIHVLLQTLLGLPVPVYHHHRLLLDKSGKRFAKRDQASTLKSMRESGVSAADVIARFDARDDH